MVITFIGELGFYFGRRAAKRLPLPREATGLLVTNTTTRSCPKVSVSSEIVPKVGPLHYDQFEGKPNANS